MKRPSDALTEALFCLANVTACLQESHGPELASKHGGDSKRTGEYPLGCSYCFAIAQARALLSRDRAGVLK